MSLMSIFELSDAHDYNGLKAVDDSRSRLLSTKRVLLIFKVVKLERKKYNPASRRHRV